MQMNENIKVSEILTYRKNEIKIVCKFQTLFDLFQDQVAQKVKELEEKFNQEKIIEKEQHKEVKLSLIPGNNEKRNSLTSTPLLPDDLDHLLGGQSNNGPNN